MPSLNFGVLSLLIDHQLIFSRTLFGRSDIVGWKLYCIKFDWDKPESKYRHKRLIELFGLVEPSGQRLQIEVSCYGNSLYYFTIFDQ